MAKASTKTTAAEAATYEEIGRRYVDYLRVEREHRRITQADPSQTISHRSEPTLALRRAEAAVRAAADKVIDCE